MKRADPNQEAETRVGDELASLAPHLDAATPDRLADRLRDAVQRAARQERRTRTLRRMAGPLAAAAAVLLTVSLNVPLAPPAAPLWEGAEEVGLAWADATDDSLDRFTLLTERSWLATGLGDDEVDTGGLSPDDLGDSIGESLERLSELVGA